MWVVTNRFLLLPRCCAFRQVGDTDSWAGTLRFATAFRSLRVLRVLRLVRKAKGLRIMFLVAGQTLPQIMSLVVLLVLVLLAFSLLFFYLFAGVPLMCVRLLVSL